jgi:hypothetical protein
LLLLAAVLQAQAGGGPLGIDHRLAYDNSGIWKRSNQTSVEYGTLAVVIGGALWEGGETRLGKTCWQARCGGDRRRAYYAYHRDTPSILGVMPHQVTVGLKKRF